MKQSSLVRILLVLALGSLAPGCSTWPTPQQGVPLVWMKGDETLPATMTNLYPHRLKLTRFVDRRAQPSLIGLNVQRPADPVPVTTAEDVGAWTADRFVYLLRRQGVEVVDSGETLEVEVELTTFLVTEDRNFEGEVAFSATFRRPGGEVLWRGAGLGRSRRWGRTSNLTNYYEAITIALDQAVTGLVANPSLLAALSR